MMIRLMTVRAERDQSIMAMKVESKKDKGSRKEDDDDDGVVQFECKIKWLEDLFENEKTQAVGQQKRE